MPKITFGALKSELRQDIFPAGEADNLVVAHNKFFVEAIIDLQRWIECLQVNNTNLYPFCSTYYECGKSIIDLPQGVIKRVYTIANSEWCDRVFYWPSEYNDIECWVRESIIAPANPLVPVSMGMRPAHYSTNSSCGRGRTGIFAIHRRRLYVAPWIQSNETIVVEWDGIKRQWADEDLITNDPDVLAAIRSYVRMSHARDFDKDMADFAVHKSAYEEQRADLMFQCREETRKRSDPVPCGTETYATQAMIDDDAIPDYVSPPTEASFAIIGDYGDPFNGTAEADVAAMVKSWNPVAIFTVGDNDYVDDFDVSVGQFYADYIYPYVGTGYTSTATYNRFWPIPANHDWAVGPDNDLGPYKEFFSGLPGNKRYYDVVLGHVHFFCLSSDDLEPDGNTPDSAQAEWCRIKMQLSTARWKVVLIQDPPYTSAASDYPGVLKSRWPFEEWGADLVISGDEHHYERLRDINTGFYYLVNGAGGRSLVGFNSTPHEFSEVRIEDYGAQKCIVDYNTFRIEFWRRTGILGDVLELTKT